MRNAAHIAAPPARATVRPRASAESAGRATPPIVQVGFEALVGAEPLTGEAAIAAIRNGYAVQILKQASHFFNVPDARIQYIARVPASTASRLEKKQARIDPAATERVYRMGTVTRMAIDVFEDQAAAVAWMRQPNRALGGAAPLDLMDTEPGAVAVRQVLDAIASGSVA